EVVEVAQERERVGDGRGTLPGRRPVVEASARGDVQVDLLVAAAERGRPQRRQECDLVERVVDRAQKGREVAHLLTLEEGAPGLGADRDPGAAERLEVDVEL